jgi:hypothetical protein
MGMAGKVVLPFATGHVAPERSGGGMSAIPSQRRVRGPEPVLARCRKAEWMKYKLARTLLVVTTLVLVMSVISALSVARPAMAAPPDDPDTPTTPWPVDDPRYNPQLTDNVILKWDDELLQTIRGNPRITGPTITARALGVLHTATYDAWAAYDPVAKATRPDSPTQQPVSSDPSVNLANKNKAISFAAYKVLVALFPSWQANYVAQMNELEYTDLNDSSPPATVGNTAAQAVLNYRNNDGSNQQLGIDAPTGLTVVKYPDNTGYTTPNTWDKVNKVWHWQPLCVPLPAPGASCTGAVQAPLTPQWGNVKPFALLSAFQYKVLGPRKNLDGSCCDPADIDTAVADTSNLSDRQKVTAEYWADGPTSEFPPGHWALFAQILSRKRGNSLDTDAKMFFALGNAMLDASVAAWAYKFKPEYDFWRPTTAIRYRYDSTGTYTAAPHIANPPKVNSWLGPYKGFGDVPGDQWRPYQAPGVVTPAFPEYVSGHSTFSGAGGTLLAGFTGSDTFGATVTIKAGTSRFEPADATHVGTPVSDIQLSWPTFTAAGGEAGMSRRYGGIHFKSGDMDGRALGKQIASTVWGRAQNYINGYTGY